MINKLKNLRRFQTKNTDSFLKLKFWIINDEEFAKKLGIDTEADLGDLYVIKECNEINQLANTTTLNGKDLYIKKVNNVCDSSRATEIYIEIVSISLALPIIVHDFISFAQLYSRYQSPTLIVYCEKDHPDYDKIIMAETFKARQNFPLELKKMVEDNAPKELKNNLLFVVSTTPMLIPLFKLASRKPRIFLVYPQDDKNAGVDLRENYWKDLKKIDGMTFEEFMKKVAEKPKNDEGTEDEKESIRAKFSEERFMLTKAYSMKGDITAENITSFIDAADKGKLKYFFESEDIPSEEYSERVVGEDFKKKILQSKQDCLVFLEHPIEKENRGYKKIFERYAKNHPEVNCYSIKDFNENEVFKLMKYNSPTVLNFKAQDKLNPEVLDIRRDLVKDAPMKTPKPQNPKTPKPLYKNTILKYNKIILK